MPTQHIHRSRASLRGVPGTGMTLALAVQCGLAAARRASWIGGSFALASGASGRLGPAAAAGDGASRGPARALRTAGRRAGIRAEPPQGRRAEALTRVARRALAALLLAGLCACQPGEPPAPAPECREFGALCKLESGPLGVCESRPCRADETAPCLTCTSQH